MWSRTQIKDIWIISSILSLIRLAQTKHIILQKHALHFPIYAKKWVSKVFDVACNIPLNMCVIKDVIRSVEPKNPITTLLLKTGQVSPCRVFQCIVFYSTFNNGPKQKKQQQQPIPICIV